MTASKTANAAALADRTSDAYMAGSYGSSWLICARLLLKLYDERTAEAILRSKYMRWASDHSGRASSNSLKVFMEKYPDMFSEKALVDLVEGTF